jgi:Flp pilus assembly protein TadD
MSAPKVSNENAERLKAQGNTLHVNGQYRAAYKKYTEAIREDPMNAVYWANRAASGLAMKEYVST